MTTPEDRDRHVPEPTAPIYQPRLEILPSEEAVDAFAASMVLDQIRSKPDSALTLPTGNTPIGMYGLIVAEHRRGTADLSGVTILNLDEYYPMNPSNPDSYASFMRRNLLDHVTVREAHIPNGEAADPNTEAERYEQLIAGKQPIDLAVISLGPGTTCHIAFNERGSSLDSRVRYVTLDQQTIEANGRLFEDPTQVPTGALTQGVANILEAQSIIFIAKGAHKAWGVNRALKGPVSSDAPASFLRLHPNVTAVLDQAAAQYLR